MSQSTRRASGRFSSMTILKGLGLIGLLLVFVDDAAAQRLRRPQRPGRPGMNRRAPAANPAGFAANPDPNAASSSTTDVTKAAPGSAIKNLAGANSPVPE